MLLANRHNVSLTKLLLERGADVNAADDNGNTALMNACRNRDTGMVKLLLSYHAREDVKDGNGDSPLEHAKRAGDSGVIALLSVK
jgi:ankyrin repeat protein